jgi:hypothetical protein
MRYVDLWGMVRGYSKAAKERGGRGIFGKVPRRREAVQEGKPWWSQKDSGRALIPGCILSDYSARVYVPGVGPTTGGASYLLNVYLPCCA